MEEVAVFDEEGTTESNQFVALLARVEILAFIRFLVDPFARELE
jgi:hypothetical protein